MFQPWFTMIICHHSHVYIYIYILNLDTLPLWNHSPTIHHHHSPPSSPCPSVPEPVAEPVAKAHGTESCDPARISPRSTSAAAGGRLGGCQKPWEKDGKIMKTVGKTHGKHMGNTWENFQHFMVMIILVIFFWTDIYSMLSRFFSLDKNRMWGVSCGAIWNPMLGSLLETPLQESTAVRMVHVYTTHFWKVMRNGFEFSVYPIDMSYNIFWILCMNESLRTI